MDKQSRRDKYQDKKGYKEKHKVKKQTENEEDKAFFQEISKYSLQKLLKFLQDKYDDYVAGNEKLGFKLNNQIGKRIMQIPVQINANQFKKVKSCLEAQNIKVSDQKLNKLFQNRQITFDAQNLKITFQYPVQNFCVVDLLFNYSKPNVYVRKFWISKVPQQLYHNPLNKRMKKQAIEILQNLQTFVQKINSYEKN